MMSNKEAFTPEQIALIRAEWARGTSVRKIGQMIGKPKSSVGAKIFRSSLPKRPSPIKRNEAKNNAAKDPKKQSKPGRPQTAQSSLYAPENAKKTYTEEKIVRGSECLWCDGKPGAWILCQKPIAKSFFCEEHAEIGLVKNIAVVEKE